MQISTTARHCEIDSGLRQLAQQRLERLEKFASDIHEARVIVTGEKSRHVAEITLRLNQHELVSREHAQDLREALLGALDSLEHQVRRVKEKRIERRQRPGGAPEPAAATGDGSEFDDED